MSVVFQMTKFKSNRVCIAVHRRLSLGLEHVVLEPLLLEEGYQLLPEMPQPYHFRRRAIRSPGRPVPLDHSRAFTIARLLTAYCVLMVSAFVAAV